MASSKTRLYYTYGLKQLYACTMESTNFMNPQILSNALSVLVWYSLGLLVYKSLDSIVHVYNYYLTIS